MNNHEKFLELSPVKLTEDELDAVLNAMDAVAFANGMNLQDVQEMYQDFAGWEFPEPPAE